MCLRLCRPDGLDQADRGGNGVNPVWVVRIILVVEGYGTIRYGVGAAIITIRLAIDHFQSVAFSKVYSYGEGVNLAWYQ